jgi:hypothetical protein
MAEERAVVAIDGSERIAMIPGGRWGVSLFLSTPTSTPTLKNKLDFCFVVPRLPFLSSLMIVFFAVSEIRDNRYSIPDRNF